MSHCNDLNMTPVFNSLLLTCRSFKFDFIDVICRVNSDRVAIFKVKTEISALAFTPTQTRTS